MAPGLGLAAFDRAVASVELLTWIIKTTQEVILFKVICNTGELANMLKDVFIKHEAMLKAPNTFRDLKSQLEHIDILTS